MIYDKICELCKKNEITITQVEKILEFGNGTIRSWKNSSPSLVNAKKVADFFEVKVDDLLSEEK